MGSAGLTRSRRRGLPLRAGVRTRGGGGERLVVAAIVVGLLGSAGLVWQATSAAFTASTVNAADSWAAGTVGLSDDDGGAAMFTVSGLSPGDSGTRCLTVGYTGDLAATVTTFGTTLTDPGDVAPYLQLTIEDGSGGGYGSCAGFTPAATLYSGTLAAFVAAHPDGVSGVGTWAPPGPQTRTYRISYTVDPATPNDRQSAACSVTFSWQARA